MLNIPQLQQEWLGEDDADFQSPCPTNYTSFSDSLHLNHTAFQHLKNQRKYSHPPHQSSNWTQVQKSIFGWFDDKKITLGHPEEIIEGVYESKKEVVRKLSGDAALQEKSNFERRRGRKLTISI